VRIPKPPSTIRSTDWKGSYAIAAIIDGSETIYAARQGSPLVVGVGDDCTYLASDVPAFVDHTRDVVFLEDGHRVIATKTGYTVLDGDREPVDVDVETVSYTAEATGKSGYDHYMLKEIHEQPTALRQCFSGRSDALAGTVTLEEIDEIPQPNAVQFVACGTSYHAALYGAAILRDGESRPKPISQASTRCRHRRSRSERSWSVLPKAARLPTRSLRCGTPKPRCQHARAHQHSQLDGRPRV